MAGTVSTDLAGAGARAFAVADESSAPGLQVTLAPGATSYSTRAPPGAAETATTDGHRRVGRARGSASAVAQAASVVDQRTDKGTTVTDTFDGGTPVDLGTLDSDDVSAAPDHRVPGQDRTRAC